MGSAAGVVHQMLIGGLAGAAGRCTTGWAMTAARGYNTVSNVYGVVTAVPAIYDIAVNGNLTTSNLLQAAGILPAVSFGMGRLGRAKGLFGSACFDFDTEFVVETAEVSESPTQVAVAAAPAGPPQPGLSPWSYTVIAVATVGTAALGIAHRRRRKNHRLQSRDAVFSSEIDDLFAEADDHTLSTAKTIDRNAFERICDALFARDDILDFAY